MQLSNATNIFDKVGLIIMMIKAVSVKMFNKECYEKNIIWITT
jgi:hypothetical protein